MFHTLVVWTKWSSCPLNWPEIHFAYMLKVIYLFFHIMLCSKAISSFFFSCKLSDFPVAKLTYDDEAPPKPPRLFLMAKSKEPTPSPANSPVICANRETFICWLIFFQGPILIYFITGEITCTFDSCLLISWADWSPRFQSPVSYSGMESSRKSCSSSLVTYCFSCKMRGRSALAIQGRSTQ